MLHPGPAEHDGTAPALIRSICGSLSRSAAKAFPPNNRASDKRPATPSFHPPKTGSAHGDAGNNAPISGRKQDRPSRSLREPQIVLVSIKVCRKLGVRWGSESTRMMIAMAP